MDRFFVLLTIAVVGACGLGACLAAPADAADGATRDGRRVRGGQRSVGRRMT